MKKSYEEFVEAVFRAVEVICKDQPKKVLLQKVVKNNDTVLDALNLTDENTKISPTIYLNHFYEVYEQGKSIEEIAKEVYDLYRKNERRYHFKGDEFSEFDQVKNNIAFRLVNTKLNQKLLGDVPHRTFLDLSLIYYVVLNMEEECGHWMEGCEAGRSNASVLIHNSHLSMWECKEEELYQFAWKNTRKLYPEVIRSMEELLSSLLVEDLERDSYLREETPSYDAMDLKEEALQEVRELNEHRSELQMYVLTNTAKLHGASCVLYDQVLARFSEKVDCDLFILPSSIHEVILVPARTGICKRELDQMVKEVNQEAVDPEEILSDHAYYYHRKEDQISMA